MRDDGSGTSEVWTRALSSFSSCAVADCSAPGDSTTFAARIGGDDVLDWCEDGMEALPCASGEYIDGTCTSNAEKRNCFGVAGECEGVSWVRDSGRDSSGRVTCEKAAHGGVQWSYTRGSGNMGVVAAVGALEGSIGYAVYSDAAASGLPIARLINLAGNAVQAGVESLASAVMQLGSDLDERGNALIIGECCSRSAASAPVKVAIRF